MINKKINILLLLIVMVILSGCAGLSMVRTVAPHRRVIIESGNETYIAADYRAYYHYILGYNAEFNRDYVLALEEYVRALQYDPTSFYLTYQIGKLLSTSGDNKYASIFIKKALKVSPRNKHALLFLAELQLSLGEKEDTIKTLRKLQDLYPDEIKSYLTEIRMLSTSDDAGKAVELIEKITDRFADSYLLYYHKGRALAIQKKYTEAILSYQKATELKPLYTLAHMGIGMAYEANGEVQKAIETYVDILENIAPQSVTVLDRLVSLYVSGKEYGNALDGLDRLIEKMPHNINVYAKKGLIYLDKKDYENAIEVWKYVVSMMPDSIKFRSYLAYAYEQQENIDQAIVEYEKMLEVDPYYADTYFHIGFLYGKIKKHDLAEKNLKEAVKLDPDKPEFHLYLGMNYVANEQLGLAEEAFLEGLEIDLSNTDLHFNLGVLYEKLDNLEGVVGEMEAVLELEPDNSHAMNYIAYMYAVKGVNLENALDYVNKALDSNPDSGYFLDSLGWIYYKMEKYVEAEEALAKALKHLGDDPVINEHIGDVYMELDKLDEAKNAWVKSLIEDPTNEELIKKYKEKGFGDPMLNEEIQKSLEKLKETDAVESEPVKNEASPESKNSKEAISL